MSHKLAQLLEKMNSQERAEVETFAAFIIARRNLQKPHIITDDISIQELIELVTESGSFAWLDAEEEDIYSLEDGEAIQWPNK
jgi:hypothetical protein